MVDKYMFENSRKLDLKIFPLVDHPELLYKRYYLYYRFVIAFSSNYFLELAVYESVCMNISACQCSSAG